MRRMFVECRISPQNHWESNIHGCQDGCQAVTSRRSNFGFPMGVPWHLKYWPAFACYACCSLRKNIWIENPPCCCEAVVLVAVGIFHIVKRAPNKIVYDASFCSFSLSMFYFLGPELAEIRLCMSPILEFISKLYIGGLQIELRLSTPSISQFIPCLSHYFEPSLELPLAPHCFWDASKGCPPPPITGPSSGPHVASPSSPLCASSSQAHVLRNFHSSMQCLWVDAETIWGHLGKT